MFRLQTSKTLFNSTVKQVKELYYQFITYVKQIGLNDINYVYVYYHVCLSYSDQYIIINVGIYLHTSVQFSLSPS